MSGSNKPSGSFTGVGVGIGVSVNNEFNIFLQGTFEAQLIIEVSADDGANYMPDMSIDLMPVTLTKPGSYQGYQPEKGILTRIRCVSYVSGPVYWRISQ